MQVWARLPLHLRAVAAGLNGRGPGPGSWAEFFHPPDVCSKSKTDFGFCSLTPFVILVAEGSAPATPWSHRISPIIMAKEDATLNQYLAAGLIRHSTSPHSSPLVVISETSRGVQITVNYKKCNQMISLSQLLVPRVDQVLDTLGKGLLLPGIYFCSISSFHQNTVHKDTVPLTTICTPMRLYEWLVTAQGSSASPGWFGKAIHEVS